MTRKLNVHTLALWAALPMARTAQVESRLQMILKPNADRRALTRRAALVSLIAAALGVGTLAALRPAARAQTAPAPPPAGPLAQALPIQRLDLRFSSATFSGNIQAVHGGRMTISTAPDFTINGTRLLAGVVNPDKLGTSWWSGEGILLPKPVFDLSAGFTMPDAPAVGQRHALFAFRLPPALRGATVKYDLPQSVNTSSSSVIGQTGKTEAELYGQTGGARVVIATYPAAVTQATVRIGFASAAWENSYTDDPKHTSGLSTDFGHFVFGPALETGGGVSVSVAASGVTRDVRLVAVDVQGRSLTPAQSGDESQEQLEQITAQFNLPLSQVKEFHLETRPLAWIEFKNVALQPAQH